MSKNKSPRLQQAAGDRLPVAKNISSRTQKLRAREPISRSFGLIRGKFPARKMARMIHWESQLERDAVLLFEFSAGVRAFREQPLTTYYTLNGKTRRYTPDFEITLHSGEVILIEIKPAEKLLDPKERARFDRIREHFLNHDQQFRILTDEQIRQVELLENLRLLMRYRGQQFTPFECRRFRRTFGRS